ncbi:Uncharacterized protein GBIM_00187 [Gryllus bimaculatus]|nr:Uncharacterized protein GBIM_00187 [Gryllus bimaculatus]
MNSGSPLQLYPLFSVVILSDATDLPLPSPVFQLDDAALQLYKDGDYGSYLDLEASLSEQQEELEGFQDKNLATTIGVEWNALRNPSDVAGDFDARAEQKPDRGGHGAAVGRGRGQMLPGSSSGGGGGGA